MEKYKHIFVIFASVKEGKKVEKTKCDKRTLKDKREREKYKEKERTKS